MPVTGTFDVNEWGLWCAACGQLLALPDEMDEESFEQPEQCKHCGWPDEFDPVRAGFADAPTVQQAGEDAS